MHANGIMLLSRATPTLSGAQVGSFTTVAATTLTAGTGVITGVAHLTTIMGTGISDSLVLSSATTAASAAAVSNIWSRCVHTSGGVISGTLGVSNLNVMGTLTAGGNVAIGKGVATYALDVSGAVSATSFVGSGALLTGIASGGGGSPWSTSGSNVFTMGSNVGIGKVPGSVLDVSGNVSINGTITTGNSCALRYWKISGTTPSTVSYTLFTTLSTYGLNSTTVNSIVGLTGSFKYMTGMFYPMNCTYGITSGDPSMDVSLWVQSSSLCIQTGPSCMALSLPFTVVITTTS